MTILEELIDVALKSCEKSRSAGLKYHHARGCALLTSNGKVVIIVISPLDLKLDRYILVVMYIHLNHLVPRKVQIGILGMLMFCQMLALKRLQFLLQFQMVLKILRCVYDREQLKIVFMLTSIS